MNEAGRIAMTEIAADSDLDTRPLVDPVTRPAPSHRGAAALGFALVVIAGSFALTVDVPRAGYGVKADEATYVAAALSAAFDHNLSYERRDFERFEGLYHGGPEGIFLKRGRTLLFRATREFPFIRNVGRGDPRGDRLYYSKALLYPVLAAPLVRIFGLNGMLVLHVVLLAVVGVCGYLFLAARSSSAGAALFTTAFLGASVVPVYGVFLQPEILNLALVFVAYFFWLYKEVQPTSRLADQWTDLVAAVLLGLATYSKPTNGLLVAPLVLYACWRRQWRWSIAIGALAVAVAGVAYAGNAVVSGEFNYQGGDRKTFYSGTTPISGFPFESPDATWDQRGSSVSTSGEAQQRVLTSSEAPSLFAHNVVYFLIGRHFGFLPYFFPGAVAVGAWLLSRARRDAWRVLCFAAFVVFSLMLIIVLPYTWSGGGGPPGNRYLLSSYPALFFLMPPVDVTGAAMLAWIGGALFTAKMLLNPFVAAKYPYLTTEKGPARRLPIELTMVHDLPYMLDASRARIPYGHDPTMFLYFLDQNAWPPEPPGMWVSGGGRADVIVRTVDPIDHLVVSAASPINTVLTASLGADQVVVPLAPGKPASFTLKAGRGVRYVRGWACVMSVRSSEGFVPHAFDPASPDTRNLGAVLRFSAVSSSARTP